MHNHLSHVYNVTPRVAHIDARPCPPTPPSHLCVLYKEEKHVKLTSACGSLLTTDISALLSASYKTRNVTRRLRNTTLYHVSGMGLSSPTSELDVRIFWFLELRLLKLQTPYFINCLILNMHGMNMNMKVIYILYERNCCISMLHTKSTCNNFNSNLILYNYLF